MSQGGSLEGIEEDGVVVCSASVEIDRHNEASQTSEVFSSYSDMTV